jgi:hypothetical protein
MNGSESSTVESINFKRPCYCETRRVRWYEYYAVSLIWIRVLSIGFAEDDVSAY